jgi:RNA polymerase sigma factor (sigma-70 family)
LASDEEFAEFVVAALPRLLRFAHMLTGNPTAAEDLVQTALARSWRAWRLRSIDDPQAYARKVMVNSYATWYRRAGQRETATVAPADAMAAEDHAWRVLATSLYDDPAAELHEDASARLGEHLAVSSRLILRRSSPGVRRPA